MKAGFEKNHLLDGPTAPIWNCILGLYNECYEYENAHPDDVPSDSGNSDISNLEPVSGTLEAIASIIPFELLSVNQIGSCIHSKMRSCGNILSKEFFKIKGKYARDIFKKRFESENKESFALIQVYERLNGTVPSAEILKNEYERRDMLNGPTAPYWNCFLGIYNECYDFDNSHPDEVPIDTGE